MDSTTHGPQPGAGTKAPLLTIGTVVDYHGTITAEHCEQFLIIEVGARLRLQNREYPRFGIRDVHPGHVTRTGETAEMCGCGAHERGYCYRDYHAQCQGCTCNSAAP
ncbi:hypothetical protein [Amycolatopsis anabasis]|uniref:hypothetical protein n=1 Tax=Amycolatopsis anabasis TaxID=1840409 RepID=UPI00131C8F07|nr:hypothetical protein [Amycolatopsis anabasis]